MFKNHKEDEEFKQQVMEDLPGALPERLSNVEIEPVSVTKFAAMHNDLGWDLNYIIAGDNKKNISKKGTIDYTFEGIKHFFLEATPDVQEEIRAIVLEQYLSELRKKRK